MPCQSLVHSLHGRFLWAIQVGYGHSTFEFLLVLFFGSVPFWKVIIRFFGVAIGHFSAFQYGGAEDILFCLYTKPLGTGDEVGNMTHIHGLG